MESKRKQAKQTTEGPPPPKEESFCWDFYFGLAPGHCINDDWQANLKKVQLKDPSIVSKAKQALSWDELDQHAFANESEAALALVRALALIDSTDRSPESMISVKSYLLMGRAALYLAREAHYRYNLDKAPTGLETLEQRHEDASLAKAMKDCILLAAEDRVNISLCMSRFAWLVVGQVATDKGKTARPAMAEAWLVLAQVELMLAEVEASLGQVEATKIRPKDRLGPFDDIIEDADELPPEEIMGWRLSIPGQQMPPSQDMKRVYLADYWWGQTVDPASKIACLHCSNAWEHMERYTDLATDTIRKARWIQEQTMTRELHRRAAAALMSLDAASKNDPELDLDELVESLRELYPGTPFVPTEAFCRQLTPWDPDNPEEDRWNMTCQLGSFGVKSLTMLTVMDTSANSPWTDMLVGSKLLHGDEFEASYRNPTPREVYDTLLEAMAGSGSELRCMAGPPRRPHLVVMSYRLRDSFQAVKELLCRVDVKCVLDSEESLRFACANNHTDFETGGIPQQEQTLVGQRVGICELHKRPELNGRVGRVLKFHADQERWEVKLERIAPGETSLKIGLKPVNLSKCPSKFESPQEYLRFRDSVRSWSGTYAEEEPKKTDDAAVAALLDKLRAHGEVSDETICAICQESSKSATASSTMLPCGHAFHLDCVLPWIREHKLECPVCRNKF